ncbi:peptidase family T4 protein [Metarhizium album ARSEF 1941]|uniref:Peptidase family T4 protein n=1 Tax=Metarhizium album (strain ARSEF 1941) TaxID=1081103 RepID=A0A0B2WK39_METAS|nr:peptidase family T4 protein [Metarhizium album ARSEF 1941]KHN93832.1 peptidase family T4 protein [Metarhizium album ARSEF 1941]
MPQTTGPRRDRIRAVIPDVYLGRWPPGRLNSMTDVPGVLVHTQSIEPDSQVHTGVTTILPRRDWYQHSSFAGVFRFNGCGEMTGSHWLSETGLLSSPVVITATSSVGEGYRGVTAYAYRRHRERGSDVDLFVLPVVAETYDGFLSDPARFAVTPEHVIEGIEGATSDAVREGNTGGGTGMICHRFKGGTGSSSRLVRGYGTDGQPVDYTVGVLVQANYGVSETLRIGGVPVGRILQQEGKLPAGPGREAGAAEPRKDGSIIIVVATDAPLIPIQLQRLAARATVGLAKVGGYGSNNSGDIFLAFSTANKVPFADASMESPAAGAGVAVDGGYAPAARVVTMSDNDTINGLFEAAADATEEAIYNAMFMAESMTGYKGRHVPALDLDEVKRIVESRL